MSHHNTPIVCLFVLASAVAQPASAQCPTDANVLLAEVRALRQAIEALAFTGLRIQIVFGRLQLQEQRTNSALQRLHAVREKLMTISKNAAEMSEEVKRYEENAATARDAEQHEVLTKAARNMKSHLSRLEAHRTKISVEESDAANHLALEQGRWSELNSFLDELERTLVRKPR
jgi:CRISPR/Cas system-associated exonuclease Cas4 (RecB family)